MTDSDQNCQSGTLYTESGKWTAMLKTSADVSCVLWSFSAATDYIRHSILVLKKKNTSSRTILAALAFPRNTHSDGGDQVCGDEGEVRGQKLCVGTLVLAGIQGRERERARKGCGMLLCLPASSRKLGSLRT